MRFMFRASLMAGVSAAMLNVPTLHAQPLSNGGNQESKIPKTVSVKSAAVSHTTAAASAPETGGGGIETVVVTANKRVQSINHVGMTITVVSGNQLITDGITSTSDLAKIVPGLTAEPSPFGTPIYTLRGVGFYDQSMSASPAVAVYLDQVPLPYSAMTRAGPLDVQRVEVLKGPQGILFGNNTTGGAINYIPNQPTDNFQAGVVASYGRFNTVDLQGFVSGPISDTVKARLSAQSIRGGAWQYSITRNDTLGAQRKFQGRLLVDWDPNSRLSVQFNVNGWLDQSDSQAPQRIATFLSVPSNPQAAATLAYPYPPHNARAADWSTNIPPLRQNDNFMQGSVRADYQFNREITGTSISAFDAYTTNSYDDYDGTAENIADNHTRGHIFTYSQELRLAGNTKRTHWLIGGNYEADFIYDRLYYYFGDSTTSQVGPYHMTYTYNDSRQDQKTSAGFADIQYSVFPKISVEAGVRYTDSRRSFEGCTYDIPGGGVAKTFNFLETLFRNPALPFIPIPQGGCVTFNAAYAPAANHPITNQLNENNLSWKGGINYKTDNGGLLYLSITKGYKAGGFPTASASSIAQYNPVKQESVLAYEGGFKQPFFHHHLQMNGAVFYYNYNDKQLEGRVLDPVFGPLDALVQIPKSHILGAEGEVEAEPLDGLLVDVAATYLDTRIDQFVGYNNAAVLQNYAGASFPYAPKWSIIGNAHYEWPVTDALEGFVDGGLTYNSTTTSSIGNNPYLLIKSYALLDLSAGVGSPDGHWKFEIWGRNITNAYYFPNALQSQDVYVRFTGMPVTYGVRFTYLFQ